MGILSPKSSIFGR